MAKEQLEQAKRNDGRLFRAVIRGDLSTVTEELRSGDVDLEVKIGGKSFLRHAGERGFKQIADALIRSGMDPDERFGKQDSALLHFAANTFNFGFASLLLEHGAEPTVRNYSGATPLHIAARTGQAYLTTRLLLAGADINAEDNRGRTPLSVAFNKGMADTARILSSRGARESAVRSKNSNVLLLAHRAPLL